MLAIDGLRQRLDAAFDKPLRRDWDLGNQIDLVVEALRQTISDGLATDVPTDRQVEAIERFWVSQRLDSLRDARLVSFGIALKVGPGRCVIEDAERFQRLLENIDQFLPKPLQYRRCYQGLLTGYFDYDPNRDDAPAVAKRNWQGLRHYLGEHAARTIGSGLNPKWVEVVQANSALFTEQPCAPYGTLLLRGREAEVDDVRGSLGISNASWFTRQLVLAMVDAATAQQDDKFVGSLPRMLDILKLDRQITVRDEGLARLLDRHAETGSAPLSVPLRDGSVEWWGNPWLRSNSMRWARVSKAAKAMVTDWLKLEFIGAFFSLLVEERSGDARRLQFWRRYVHAIDTVYFALGADARESSSPDFVKLRKQIQGLSVPLHDAARGSNAFVMKMGKVAVVEFSGHANACYGYNSTQPLPFDVSFPVVTPVDGKNSLKRSQHLLRWKHQDDVRGYARWEDRFEASLKHHFGLVPSAPLPKGATDRRPQAPAPAKLVPRQQGWLAAAYTRQALDAFCRQCRLVVDDRTDRHGNLWVLSDAATGDIADVLGRWGFKFRPSRGWWK